MVASIPNITAPVDIKPAEKPEVKKPETTEPNIGTLLAKTEEIKTTDKAKLDFVA